MDYINAYGVKTKVRVMDIREIVAEKIRAMSDRVKYRDFYDFSMIMTKLKVNLNEVLTLVEKKEIRSTISIKKIMSNWNLAILEKENDFDSIYYTQKLENNIITRELKKLNFEDFKII